MAASLWGRLRQSHGSDGGVGRLDRKLLYSVSGLPIFYSREAGRPRQMPGVIPVGIGKVLWSVLAKLILHSGRAQAKEACGSVNLCSGLKTSIEGGIHAMCDRA